VRSPLRYLGSSRREEATDTNAGEETVVDFLSSFFSRSFPPVPSAAMIVLQPVPASKKRSHRLHQHPQPPTPPTPPILPPVRRESLPLTHQLLTPDRPWPPPRKSSLPGGDPSLPSPPTYPPIGVGVDLAALFSPKEAEATEDANGKGELKRFASLRRVVSRGKRRREKVEERQGWPGPLTYEGEEEVRFSFFCFRSSPV
jgi:hypothetical protein